MSAFASSYAISGFLQRLVQNGDISLLNMQSALRTAKITQQDIVACLIEQYQLCPQLLATTIATEYGENVFNLDHYDIQQLPQKYINIKLILQYRIVPLFQHGQTLHVATSNPNHIAALDAIRLSSKCSIHPMIVEYDKLENLIKQQFEKHLFNQNNIHHINPNFSINNTTLETNNTTTQDDAAPVIKYLNTLLYDAIQMKASDLHFEPYEHSYRIRYRIDGILRQIASPPAHIANRLSARLKVMAQLDIAEKRIPQDGRFSFPLSAQKNIDFRLNTLPTLFGEKLVLRILERSNTLLDMDLLGYEDEQKVLFLEALQTSQGMLLITGPTGSGKTVSLYTGLHLLNTEHINISTVEDPIEIQLAGINQVNVNQKIGLSFPHILKAFLRQDPDVIMIGEIRDLETAETAIQAAQTGHLVMSTLHTNSAPEALSRLRQIGIPAFNLATSIHLVIAQRLARRLCAACKTPIHIPKHSLQELGFAEQDLSNPNLKIFQAVGCTQCRDGYKGQIGIYEVMKMTPEIAQIVMQNGNTLQIAATSKQAGFADLYASGLKKVVQGITSLQEIQRISTQ